MSKALEVVIREPALRWTDFIVRLVAGLIVTFLGAWAVMLLVPHVLGLEPSYWQVVGFMLIIRFVWPGSRFPYLRTTENQKETK